MIDVWLLHTCHIFCCCTWLQGRSVSVARTACYASTKTTPWVPGDQVTVDGSDSTGAALGRMQKLPQHEHARQNLTHTHPVVTTVTALVPHLAVCRNY